MRTGFYISGAGHGLLLLAMLFGGVFSWEDEEPSIRVTEVSILTEEQFAALSVPEARNKDSGTADLAVRYSRIVLPAQICFFMGAFFVAVQHVKQRFFLPALTGLIYHGSISSLPYSLKMFEGRVQLIRP